MKGIVWSKDAAEDFEFIVEYTVEHFSIKIAEEAYSRIIKKVEKALELPNIGKIVPELKEIGLTSYRELIEVPWRIIYRKEEGSIVIISIIDSRRNIEEILYRKIIEGKM